MKRQLLQGGFRIVNKIKINHEDVAFLFPENIKEMPEEELLKEHKRRIKRVPGSREGRPPEPWYLHDHVTFEEELEAFKWGARGNGRLKTVLMSPPTKNEIREPFYEDPVA